jgi:hypothetical protein
LWPRDGRQLSGPAIERATLKIPLRSLALVWCRQGRHPATARIETLRDALDDAAFAGRIAAFEDHDDLQSLIDNPTLKLDQLALKLE